MLLLRLAGLLLCVFVVVQMVDLRSVFSILKSIPHWVLLLSLMLGYFRYLLGAWRWQILNPNLGGQLRTRDYLRYLFIGSLFGLIMPGQLGGDVVRSLFIAQECAKDRASHILTVGVDRIIGLSSILLIGTIACLLSPQLENQQQYLLVFGIAIAIFFLMCLASVNQFCNDRLVRISSRIPWFGSHLRHVMLNWSNLVQYYRSGRWRVAGAFGLSMAIHGAWFVIVYLLATSLHIDMGFWSLSIITSLSWLITLLPVSFGGLGVRELSFVYLLGLYGVSADSAIALSLCQFGIIVVLALVGIPLIWWGKQTPTSQEVLQA